MAALPGGVIAGSAGRPGTLLVTRGGAARTGLAPDEIAEALRTEAGELWVDLDSTDARQHALLEEVFHFHPLAIEDTLNPRSRVKLEEYDGYLFAIVRGVDFAVETADPYDLETANLCFFLGPHLLVTVHAGRSAIVDHATERLERNPELLTQGVARLMHAIMDAAVDGFFPILDQIDEFTQRLEERVFVRFDQAALREVFEVKRLVLTLRRHLSPEREVFNVLSNRPSALLAPSAQVYFRDIYDHVLRITESLDTYRELLTAALDACLTQVSNRLGRATKGLTLVATLSIPFVVVSGMWGMNFARVPLASAPYGFWVLLVAQVLIAAALVAALWWRRWL